ncbi:MAG TPA: hypothetical protein VK131_10285 [Candidatus Acidoferrales bacterium]|nr:hypothetical protein [Candidatus Acidoferrales bacterium]
MLIDAVHEMYQAVRLDEERRRRLLARREDLRRLDAWLDQIESMLEADQQTVPEPLVKEIGTFVRHLEPRLHRNLQRNRSREAARVLDVLFDAQETLLPRLSDIA